MHAKRANGWLASTLYVIAIGLAHAGTEGTGSTFYGHNAGLVNFTDANANTFIGSSAGAANTFGFDNTYLGASAGPGTTTGSKNTFVGRYTGNSNTAGTGNVFLGWTAGYSETGSYKLYIDSCYTTPPCDPLIFGDFYDHVLKFNAAVGVHANSTPVSQLHFSLGETDTGGWVTSVLDNNFFVSSGARYDGTAGGWTQRSPDTNSVMAGSGGLGYRIFTHTGTAVGSTFTPTLRLHIDYSGQIGINTAPVAGDEIHTSSGAHLTSGGVWTDASSREYKENVRPLATEQAMQAVAQLVPVTYNYKADSEEKHVGFIAEDVPELVATKDRRSLSPMDIVAALTKVVQEQERVIEEKSRTVDAQGEMLGALSARLSQLAEEVGRLKNAELPQAR